MNVMELLEHFSDEVIVRVKLAGTRAKVLSGGKVGFEVSEDDPTLEHDYADYLGEHYCKREVVEWFYAKYDGECDELVVWIKEVSA